MGPEMVESRSSPALRSDRARPPESELSSISPAAKPETVTRPDTAWHRSSSRSSAVSRGTSTINALLLCSSRSRASSWLFPLDAQHPAGAGELQPVLFGQFLLGLLRHGDVLALSHPQLHRPVEPGDVQPPHRVLLRVPGGGVGLGQSSGWGSGSSARPKPWVAKPTAAAAHRNRPPSPQATAVKIFPRCMVLPLSPGLWRLVPPLPNTIAVCGGLCQRKSDKSPEVFCAISIFCEKDDCFPLCLML